MDVQCLSVTLYLYMNGTKEREKKTTKQNKISMTVAQSFDQN